MPFLSDYQCDSCHHIWEEITDSAQQSPTNCPHCQATTVSRRLSSPRLLFSNDPEIRSRMLKKRSYDHSVRTAKDNLERLRAQGKLPIK